MKHKPGDQVVFTDDFKKEAYKSDHIIINKIKKNTVFLVVSKHISINQLIVISTGETTFNVFRKHIRTATELELKLDKINKLFKMGGNKE